MKIMVYGVFRIWQPESPDVFAYTRTLGEEQLYVACNFTDKEISFSIPPEFADSNRGELLIGNYEDAAVDLSLRPYEAKVFYLV